MKNCKDNFYLLFENFKLNKNLSNVLIKWFSYFIVSILFVIKFNILFICLIFFF